jgi:hypothetical protein
LQIDGNSRKLIAAGNDDDATRIIAGGQEVEEVGGNRSTQPMPSLTQPLEEHSECKAGEWEGKLEVEEESSKSNHAAGRLNSFSVATIQK